MAAAMSKEVMKRCLTAVPLFAELSAAELEMLASSGRPMTFKKGARIFEEGTNADCCFVLTAGKAHIVLAGDRGAEILLNILTPPALVGEISLLDKSTRTASFVAVEPCHLIRIPAPALESLRQSPPFEQRLVAGLVSTVRESDDRVRAISSFPSVSRVAWCLGRIARHSGHREGSAIVIPKAHHNELAEMAGCSRETVSRALQILKRKNYIRWDTHTMTMDIDSLQRYLATELSVPDGPGR
jgi:CRP/FNR family transcriptional regulator, cyclic AMP receptor protein